MIGTLLPGQRRITSAVDEIERIRLTKPADKNSVTNFAPSFNPTTQGVDISFSLTNVSGLASVSLLRNTSADPASAKVLQTWNASASTFSFSDSANDLQKFAGAYYWLSLKPTSVTDQPVQVGPEFIVLNPSLFPPDSATAISASHSPATNGFVTVTVNVDVESSSTNSVKLYVTGYLGNANRVALTQASSSPLQFTMEATGETVTIQAVTVSAGGAESASGPSCTLTLNAAATVPAQPLQVLVTQIATGNQLSAIPSKDYGLTGYQVWRGPAGGGFGSSSLLASLSVSTGLVQYLDTTGLTDRYEYFLVAVNAQGSSTASPAASPQVIYSSALLPANPPVNTTNNATVDSIDAGTSATIRIYGPGGVGTGYSRYTGYGTPTRPYGTITGQPYSTSLYVMYTGANYVASSAYTQTLPDNWEYVGAVKTVASGGSGGTSGGGGSGGGSGGSGGGGKNLPL